MVSVKSFDKFKNHSSSDLHIRSHTHQSLDIILNKHSKVCKTISTTCTLHTLYINLEPKMNLVLLGKGLVLRGWPSKIGHWRVFCYPRVDPKKSPSSSCGRVALPPWFLGKWPANQSRKSTRGVSQRKWPLSYAPNGAEIFTWNPSMTRVLNGKQTMWSLNSRVLSVVSITEPLLHRGPTWKKLIPTITLSINFCLYSLIRNKAPSCQYIR